MIRYPGLSLLIVRGIFIWGDDMTNEQLVTLIRNHEDEAENMLQLWKQNQGMIGKIAMQYKGYAEMDDLKQEGFIGLCNAVQGYDLTEGVPFISYAVFWIRQAMRRYVDNCSSCVRIPVNMRERIQQLKKFETTYCQYYGEKPSDDEIYLYLRFDRKTIEDIRKSRDMDVTASLDTPCGDDSDIAWADTVKADIDIEGEVLDQIEQEELKAVIWPLVDDLPDEQPELLRMIYQDNAKLGDAAAKMGVSYNRAVTIRNKALRALRHPSRSKELLPFITPKALSMAYKGSRASFERTWTSSTERAAMEMLD